MRDGWYTCASRGAASTPSTMPDRSTELTTANTPARTRRGVWSWISVSCTTSVTPSAAPSANIARYAVASVTDSDSR